MNTKMTIMLVLFSCAQVYAQERPMPQHVNSSEQCPALFGEAAQHHKNQQIRTKYLNSIEEADHSINLTYNGPWRTPTRIRLQGISLVKSEPNKSAVIRIVDEIYGCKSGLYRIEVNHALGADTQVLAILHDLVLLNHKDQLRYLQVDFVQKPVWRMIWKANWTLDGEEQSTSSTSHQHSPRNSYTTPDLKSRYTKPRRSSRR